MIMKFKYIIFFITLFSAFVFSQSSSTYTRYGIGDMNYTYSARSLSLGKTGVGMLNSNFVESLNPASWADIKLTRFEFSLVLNGVRLSDKSDSRFYTDAEFKGFTFAFPISEKYGIGFAAGLIPYSRISYEIKETGTSVLADSGEYSLNYKGSGGLSKLFMGASYRTPFDWIIGASAEYYFGRRKYISTINFSNTTYNSGEYELDYRSTGFGTTVGIISQNFSDLLNSETISNLRLGVSINIISNLSTDSSLTINPTTSADTVVNGNSDMKIPYRLITGVTLQLSNKYTINLDYIFQPWSNYSFNGIKSANLGDVSRIGLGFEYFPKTEISSSKWEQIIWRTGLSYETTQYVINGEDIKQYSVFGGFSIPLGASNTFDVGLQYSLRGTTDSNLVKENFYKINVGLSFGELWFLRNQY